MSSARAWTSKATNSLHEALVNLVRRRSKDPVGNKTTQPGAGARLEGGLPVPATAPDGERRPAAQHIGLQRPQADLCGGPPRSGVRPSQRPDSRRHPGSKRRIVSAFESLLQMDRIPTKSYRNQSSLYFVEKNILTSFWYGEKYMFDGQMIGRPGTA